MGHIVEFWDRCYWICMPFQILNTVEKAAKKTTKTTTESSTEYTHKIPNHTFVFDCFTRSNFNTRMTFFSPRFHWFHVIFCPFVPIRQKFISLNIFFLSIFYLFFLCCFFYSLCISISFFDWSLRLFNIILVPLVLHSFISISSVHVWKMKHAIDFQVKLNVNWSTNRIQ